MAINTGAWLIVKKHMPTHYIGSTGPCCDHCSRALQIASDAMNVVLMDDPEMDGTDWAHPAWHRGNDYAHAMLVAEANRILDSEVPLHGVSHEPWESLRKRLARIVWKLRAIQSIAREA